MTTAVRPDDIGTPPMPAPRVRERPAFAAPGIPVLGGAILLGLAGAALIPVGAVASSVLLTVLASALLGAAGVLGGGLIMVAPGEARVIQFFGRYIGTVRENGLRWINPVTFRRKVSTRIRNHETAVMKVNDGDGNPVEIAAVVVWQVADTARAMFEVDDRWGVGLAPLPPAGGRGRESAAFVSIQTETAVRHIATSYPYDTHGDDRLSLRENAAEITEKLSAEIAARVESAGVNVIESRLTHLAYAPEIAGAMLRRQQAGAIVAARQRIVEGAVGMVELALDRLAQREVVDLDEERKATMVSNLLVVLCGDREPQPVVNTGTLYQ